MFSANSEGACPECRGTGVITLDLAFMDEVAEVCDVCRGSGYRQDVLQYKFRGKNIHEVLQQTVAEAVELFPGSSRTPGTVNHCPAGLGLYHPGSEPQQFLRRRKAKAETGR